MKKLLLVCLLTLLSFSALAGWQLDSKQSLINFVSIKKSTIAEVHHFKSLSGGVEDGVAKISIDLLSVETNIPIRNERMQSLLFDTSKYSSAFITATIDTSKLNSLTVGQRYQEELELKLDLHGITNNITATVSVTKLSDDSIMVHSVSPVILKASDFGLDQGIEALRSIAKLPVISLAVPVTFNLIFSK